MVIYSLPFSSLGQSVSIRITHTSSNLSLYSVVICIVVSSTRVVLFIPNVAFTPPSSGV